MSTPPHPIEAIEASIAAVRRANEAAVDAELRHGDAVLAEACRQLPGADLTAESQGGACVVVWWREDRPEAIAIETRLRPEEPRRAGGARRWRWEACATGEHDDVVGYGDTIREALDHLAAQDPTLEPLVAELFAEVTP